MRRHRFGRGRGPLPLVIALLGALVAGVGATATVADAAEAEQRPASFRNCGIRELGPTQCARVRVPIDRSGAVVGDTVLAVRRIQVGRRRVTRRTHAVVFLAGGPGQATTPLLADVAPQLRPLLRGRDLVGVDTRGTGRASDLVVCPEIDALPTTSAADPRSLASCARRLGPAAAFYGTTDVVADLEAVRQAAGYERLLLVGVSYGSYVAQRYAAAHPDRVSGLVLDSPVDVTGDDPYSLASFRALARVHAQSCRDRACTGVTTTPRRDLAAAVARAPFAVRVDGGHGRRTFTRVSDDVIAGLLLLGDLDPVLRATLPGVLRRAAQGDAQPLARLARETGLIAKRDDDVDPSALSGLAGSFSSGIYVATTCRDTAYPWTDATPLGAARLDAARQALAAVGPSARGGFSVATIADDWPVSMCAWWPTAPERPTVGPLPAVPTLILSGREDARTPTEVARKIAARAPRGALLAVPGLGHSVLTEGKRCVRRALQAWDGGRPIRRCPSARAPNAAPLPPESARGVGGTPRERAVRVARMSVRDAVRTLVLRVAQMTTYDDGEDTPAVRVAGLRSGSARLGTKEVRLYRFGYVPGTAVSGRLGDSRFVSVRVSGRGLRAGRYRVRNPLADGRELRTLLGLDDGIVIELSAQVRRAVARVAPHAR